MPKKKLYRTCILTIACTFALLFNIGISFAADEIVPTLELNKCTVAPRIDGNLDDQCWKNATEVNKWNLISINDSVTPDETQKAFICSDNKWLYIAFVVKHPAPSSIKPVAKHHDGRVQIENCVKIIFDPGADFNPWYIFRLSAGNIRAEQRNLRESREYQLQWDAPWRSATAKNKDGWVAEIAIPLSCLYETGEIDSKKARLDLIISSIEPVDGNLQNMKKVLYSWSPILFRYWMKPEKFGYLKGIDINEIRAPFLPHIAKVTVPGGYKTSEDGSVYYTLNTQVDSKAGRSGKAILQISDMPDGVEPTVIKKEVSIKGGSSKKFDINVPVRNPGKRNIKVELISVENNEIWQKVEIPNPEKLNILSAFSALSYYTSEQDARIACLISLDAKTISGTVLKAYDTNETLLGTEKNVSNNTNFKIPLSKLKNGKNTIKVLLETKSGNVLGASSVVVTRLSPNPEFEVKIDRQSLSLIKNGKPFVPFGIWGVPHSVEYFESMKAADINTFFAIKDMRKMYLQDAAANNLSLIMSPYRFVRELKINISDIIKGETKSIFGNLVKGIPSMKYDPDSGVLEAKPFDMLHFRLPVLQQKLGKRLASALYNKFMTSPEAMKIYSEVVNQCKVSPATLCYMTFDEPMIPLLDEDVAGLAMYNKFKELDPYRPVMVNYCGLPPDAPQATSYVDIVCSDSYGEGVHAQFRVAYALVKRCQLERRVPWMILKAERVALRRLLPQEQNAQLYACVIAGVRGFYYFNFPIISKRIWGNIAKLADDIKKMHPFLTTPFLDCNIEYSPGEYSMDKGRLPDVVCGIFKSDDGKYLLLLSNCRDYPVDVSMALPFATENCELKSLRDDTTAKLSGKKFIDKLEGYGVRAYVINSKDVVENFDSKQLNLSLVMKSHPELAPPAPKPLNRFSGDRKNMIANSSFEKASFPGWPDYYYPFHVWRAQLEEKFTLDTENPFHGKQSLRMTAQKDDNFSFYIIEGADGGHKSDPYMGDPNVEYTLSVYMRGDGQGAKIHMRSEKQKGTVMGMLTKGHVNDKIEPTTEWKRYSWKITIPAMLWFRITGPGNVWIDALQLEKSEKPTEYVEE